MTETETEVEGAESESDGFDAEIDDVLGRALELSERILEELAEGSTEEAASDIENLQEVVAEAAELLETMDLSDLPDAVDVSDLDEVVDAEDVPEAVESGDADEAIRYRKLLSVVELGELWDAVELRELWRNVREFDEAVDDVTDEDGDETDLSDYFSGDGEGDGFVDEATDYVDEAGDGETIPDIEGSELGPENGEAYRAVMQSKLAEAIGGFREKLLAVHDELAALREANRERTDAVGQPDSRNPTAYSTLASSGGPPTGGSTRHSTVPEETKYSNAPNRRRLYGDRLDDRGENDA
jgi:hypothetical protein